MEELDTQIRAYDARAMERRRTMGGARCRTASAQLQLAVPARLAGLTLHVAAGVNAAKDDTHLVTKQTKLLENKLEMSLVKLNEAVGKNKVLREDIDNLRRERCVFDQVYKKLERELHDKKREMASVIDVSNIAYEARDQARNAAGLKPPKAAADARSGAAQAQNEVAALRAQADKEQALFEAEYREASSARAHLSCYRVARLTRRRCARPAARAADRGRPESKGAGAPCGGGEDLRVRAAGGREAQEGASCAPPLRAVLGGR